MDTSAGATIRSTCPYCGVGCGVLLTPDGKGGLAVRGDPEHPANHGRLCSKGTQLGQTVGLEDRLLAPRIGGRDADWNEAFDLVAGKFTAAIAEHGPDSVAFYVSGQLLTEDYYVANKLMKGFIGSANIDTNSRLCMASSVAGHKRAFGTDTVPGVYEDIERADLVVLAGSNLAWAHPVLYQRLVAARKRRPGMRVVVIDPRRTATCDAADRHLALAPGSDVALFNGLLAAIGESGAADPAFASRLDGYDAALAAARGTDLSVTGLDSASIEEFYRMWIGSDRVITIYSQGVNQSSSGTDKVNAIINCHLATGRIGRPGTGPFSVTGQPNAMGGREVGGLANMLACHLDLEEAAHRAAVAAFWDSTRIPEAPGLKAVDMFDAVESGRIKALWIIHTNPAVTMPDADRVRDAIRGCDFTVVSDITAATDTARLADVLLPAAAWGEKAGTVTNSDRTISRQRPVLDLPGQARPDWDILAGVGRRMGWPDAFDYQRPSEIFREFAALSGIAATFGRDFDISGLADLSDSAYAVLEPVRWPVSAARSGGRFFADGRFFTPSGRGRMIPVHHRPPAAALSPARPFRLNTGRLRDQWHTMTRTAKSPRLSAHLPEPFLDIHPADAARIGLEPAALVEVESDHGRAILRARVTDTVRPGEVFAPMHWTGETAPCARIGALVAPVTDPISGQPESKAAAVGVRRFAARWHGFAVSRTAPAATADYWALTRSKAGFRLELAGAREPADWTAFAAGLFGLPAATAQSVCDPARGSHRFAFVEDGRLVAALFIGLEPLALAREWLAHRPGQPAAGILAGAAPTGTTDPGPVVCACFSVGLNTITRAIAERRLSTVEDIGDLLGAGTNCGSCRSELADLLARQPVREAAE